MTTVSATQARKQLDRLLDEVSESAEPLAISGKRGKVVLLSAKNWRAIQETLYLLSIPGMRRSIRRGLKTPVSRCARSPGW